MAFQRVPEARPSRDGGWLAAREVRGVGDPARDGPVHGDREGGGLRAGLSRRRRGGELDRVSLAVLAGRRVRGDGPRRDPRRAGGVASLVRCRGAPEGRPPEDEEGEEEVEGARGQQGSPAPRPASKLEGGTVGTRAGRRAHRRDDLRGGPLPCPALLSRGGVPDGGGRALVRFWRGPHGPHSDVVGKGRGRGRS